MSDSEAESEAEHVAAGAAPAFVGPAAQLPAWAGDWMLSGDVEDWERCIYELRLRALALEHAVRAHDEVMSNRVSYEYDVRTAAAPMVYQPIQ